MISMTWPQYRRCECTADGRRVKLSHLQCEVLSTLLMLWPAPVKKGELIEAVYPDPDREPDNLARYLDIVIHRLAAKIGGFRILFDPGFGWRLRQDNDRFGEKP